ncbi:MAG: hypothetical protein E4G94_04475 [ANME-2 cluster archaeon]|nr:MAG: hypothetical protein E4G94_04475 [ANME-2 cluster archaeon]
MRLIKKTILITLICVIFITGCVEEKVTSTELPAITASPNSGQEQETESPTQSPTVISTPEATWKPDLTLEPGYEWYQNDEFGYKIAYPKDWGTSYNSPTFAIYPLEFTSIFGSEDPLALYVHIEVIVSSNQTQSRFWETGFFLDANIPIGLEELKKQERIIEYKNISVNDKDGIELVFSPLMLYWPEAASAGIPTTARYILFTNDDLDYIIQISSSDIFYDEYEDTFEYIINSFIIK